MAGSEPDKPQGSGEGPETQGKGKKRPAKGENPEHLKPYQWKKGQSGNPGGMPKGTRHTTKLIRNEILRQLSESPHRVSAIVSSLLNVAEDEESAKQLGAFKEVRDTIDGPIVKEVKTSGDNVARVEIIDGKRGGKVEKDEEQG